MTLSSEELWKSMKTTSVVGQTGARAILRRQIWIWFILAALVLVGIGMWVRVAMEQAIRAQLKNGLETILNADVTSLRIWMAEQESNASGLAISDQLLPLTRELLRLEKEAEKGGPPLLASKTLVELRDYLRPRLAIFEYDDFFLVSPTSLVLASNHAAPIGERLSGYRKAFFDKVLTGEASVSHPYRSELALADKTGNIKAGLPTMQVASAVCDEKGTPIAVLGLRIRPEGVFTTILQVARAGNTGETYAFDRSGLLLSQSRFDESLKQVGLLADHPDANSILTLELRDPQVDMIAGERPALRRPDQPLTFMAESAVKGTKGINLDGHRDYRGVPVISAWTWLDDYDFGVVTEIDVAEALAPMQVLRRVFWLLMGLLGACAVAILIFMFVVARQQQRLRHAMRTVRQLGQYTLKERIGAGGMGAVFRAEHAFLRRPTAVKLLEPDKISDTAIARFEREVQLTSQLNHPNTIAIYDFGRTPEGLFYYAMEYLDGINLEDLVKQYGPLPEARVIHILLQVCASLAEAHGLGLIHRDIKPANILINYRGGVPDFVKVLDFGLARAVDVETDARITAANAMIGTPLYMAPEAIDRPSSVDVRTDIYAVGAVGYYLLTGVPVFRGTSIMEICVQQLRAMPTPPSQQLGHAVALRLEAFLLKCLAKSPDQRPGSAAEMRVILEECAREQPWSFEDGEKWWHTNRAPTPHSTLVPSPPTEDADPTLITPPKNVPPK